jgi:hypothetical protein
MPDNAHEGTTRRRFIRTVAAGAGAAAFVTAAGGLTGPAVPANLRLAADSTETGFEISWDAAQVPDGADLTAVEQAAAADVAARTKAAQASAEAAQRKAEQYLPGVESALGNAGVDVAAMKDALAARLSVAGALSITAAQLPAVADIVATLPA